MRILSGIDLVEISYFKTSLKNGGINFLHRVFLPVEIKNEEPMHLAGIFAAKEAVLKALSLKPGCWLQIEVRNRKDGRPFIILGREVMKKRSIKSMDLSISHTQKTAVAVFVAIT